MITIHTQFANALIAAMDAKRVTVEGLAEMCSISRNSVSAYRSGTLPGEDTMLQLIGHLNSPHLGYIYLRSNKVGAALLPEIQIRELSACFCDLQVELDDNGAKQMTLARICRDNHVAADERHLWDECVGELRELLSSTLSLLLAPVTKEKAAPIRAVK